MEVKCFTSENLYDLAKQIEDYSKKYKLKITNLSAYENNDKMLSERAIVVFEKE